MSEGIKASEIRRCSGCGEGVAKDRVPIFYRVTVEMFCIDAAAVNRQGGMETYFGGTNQGAAIARALGIDEIIARGDEDLDATHIVCQECYLSRRIPELDEDLGLPPAARGKDPVRSSVEDPQEYLGEEEEVEAQGKAIGLALDPDLGPDQRE